MPLTKSEQMARVRSRDTQPERLVRRLLREGSVRYFLQKKGLAGRPDFYIPRLRLALFVHGCFWHGHTCARGKRPKANADFWNAKIDGNLIRDRKVAEELRGAGISVMVLWTCEMQTFSTVCTSIARRYHAARDAAVMALGKVL